MVVPLFGWRILKLAQQGTIRRIAVFFPLMIVPGIVLLLAPSTVESIMNQFKFHESLGGLLQVAYFSGGVAGILVITFLMQRFSSKRIVLGSVGILSAGLLASAVSPWYPLLLIFFVMVGFANGILIAFPGVYATSVCGEESHRAQNFLYGFFSLGVLIGPLLASVMIDNLHSWRWAVALPALLVIPLSIPVALAPIVDIEEARRLSRKVLREVLDDSSRLFIGLFAAILLYIAAESAVSMWMVTYMHERLGTGLGPAHWALAGLWAGITLGRIIMGWLLHRLEPFYVAVVLSIASALLLLAAPIAGSKGAAFVLYPAVGLAYSGIYPILVGYVSRFPEDVSSSVFTIFLAAGAAGGAVFPYAVGLVNQFAGLSLGMASIALLMVGVVCFLYWTRGSLVGYKGAGDPEMFLPEV